MTLTSGGVCASSVTGDGSKATATFTGGGNVLIETVGSDGQCYECTATWENLLQVLTATAILPCDSTSCGGTGGTAGSGGTGGSCLPFELPIRTHCVDYTAFTTDCFPQPEFLEVVQIDIQGSSIRYKMTVRGLPTMGTTQNPGQFDFHPCAAGTLSGMTATGTGEFISGIGSRPEFPVCAAPEARLSFDIEFLDEARANYEGTINFDFTLDAACGSSICFASADVKGCPCPGPCP